MPYKEMYLTVLRETERAIQILIQAQKQAEELYLSHESHVIIMNEKERTKGV